MCVAFGIGFFLRCFCRLSTFYTCPLRLAFVFQLCAGVGGGGMGGRGDNVHANAACVFCFFCCVASQTLLCEALVAASCCFTLETSTMQKPRFFEAFQTKTSQLTLKINKKQDEKQGICNTFAKTLPNNKNKTQWKTKTPKHRVVDEYHTKHRVFKLSTKQPPKNKRHTPRGGRRTCYLVVLLLVFGAAVAVAVAKVVCSSGVVSMHGARRS